MSGPRTLRVADALAADGFEIWTPRRTYKRVKPGKHAKGQKLTIEVEAPILPTFVFAREMHLDALVGIANDSTSTLPAFSVFQHGGRHPLVADREVAGLKQAEQDAVVAIQQVRDADTREEAARIRAMALKTEQARRKALRAQYRDFRAGQEVTVDDMPALTGMTGVVESTDGRSAMVVFGGALSMKIEAWRLVRHAVQGAQS